jgi:glycine cleavage system H protein
MDGFSYTNIFETKGIEYLIIIGFLAALIPFWVVLNKQVKVTRQIQKVLGNLSSKILRIPQGLFYSQNHTWAHLQVSGIAKVGLDDLLMHITGEVKFSKLLKAGDSVSKGDLLTEIDQKGKTLKIYSPISGKIINSNPLLKDNPELLNDDPYGNGWIYKIKPSNWIEETYTYHLAENATEWSDKELERYKDFLAVTLNKYSPETSRAILQDGGEIIDNSLSELPNEIWQDFQKEFLNHKA